MRRADGGIHRAAHRLTNEVGQSGDQVRAAYATRLTEMPAGQATAGTLRPAVGHFLKVTRSYWPGLFHCYDVPDLPRTNNDLEHSFGSARYHQRRATGCKPSAPGPGPDFPPSRPAPTGSQPVAPTPPGTHLSAPGAPLSTPLPAQPDRLPPDTRGPVPQAPFAAVEKKRVRENLHGYC
jgi:hypothetical protein